jgi:lysophospholipase L1-like esterase
MDHGLRLSWDWRRIVRLVRIALLGVSIILAVVVGPPWFHALVPDQQLRRALIRLLVAVQVGYGVLLAVIPVLLVAVAAALGLAWRRGARRPRLDRVLALGIAVMVGLAMAEVVATMWLAWTRVPMYRLPTRFPDPPGESRVDVVVLGESSACGVPYDQWLSVGQIVAWKLQEAFPDRRFPVEHLARPGMKLDNVHQLLGSLTRRPDLVIIYAGHNEFSMRHDWAHSTEHYADETPPTRETLEGFARKHSSLCRLIQRTASRLRLEIPPVYKITRQLVDVPVYTATEYRDRLHDFRTRLEVITAYCERMGAQVVLVIPPGNDADFEPNRSILPPETQRAQREEFARRFQAARDSEAVDPVGALVAYEALLERQPGFAETHYRLARLLEAMGKRDEANQHYVAARDEDGLPMRCISEFQGVYREVAARHPEAILIDGPAVLRGLSPRGVVGDNFFNDGFHPSLNGHTALAQAILQSLHARRAFGWADVVRAPVVTSADCAAHFTIDAEKWKEVCDYAAWFYLQTAFIRFDPLERHTKRLTYLEASRRLAGGSGPDEVHVPGIGTGLLVPAELTQTPSGPRPTASHPWSQSRRSADGAPEPAPPQPSRDSRSQIPNPRSQIPDSQF